MNKRGYGYFIGIDFVKNRDSREPDTVNAKIILRRYFMIVLKISN
jgi:4-aminobutyrate aminotransferase-like enzyme